MWTLCDRPEASRGAVRRALSAAPLLLALALTPAWPASAQSHPPSASSASSASVPTGERAALKRTLEQRSEVLPVKGGVLLKLRADKAGVRTVELAGDDIMVNGERVGADVLREWLKQDADAVLQLRALAPAERRALFGFKPETASAAVSPAASAPPTMPAAPTVPAAVPAAVPTPPSTDAPEAASSAEAPEAPDADEDKPETPEEPEKPEPPSSKVHTGSQVRFGGGVTVGPEELADEVVAFGGAVHVDGQVRNDVVAIGGPVYITGHVGGDVSAVGGSVHLGPHAEIGGDVSSVGGSVIREPGATVHGDVAGVGGAHGVRFDRRHRDGEESAGWPFWLMSPIGGFLDFSWSFVKVMLLGLLVCLVLFLGRGPVDRVDTEIRSRPPTAFFVGFLSELLFVPIVVVVTIFLAISIVGCFLFLLYPFIFLGLALAVLVGYTAVAYRVGSTLERRFGRNYGSPYVTALIGVGAIELVSLLGHFVNIFGGFFSGFGVLLLVCGALIHYAALTTGIGGVILARFIERQGWRFRFTPGPVPAGGAPIPMDYEQPVVVHPVQPVEPHAEPSPEEWNDPNLPR